MRLRQAVLLIGIVLLVPVGGIGAASGIARLQPPASPAQVQRNLAREHQLRVAQLLEAFPAWAAELPADRVRLRQAMAIRASTPLAADWRYVWLVHTSYSPPSDTQLARWTLLFLQADGSPDRLEVVGALAQAFRARYPSGRLNELARLRWSAYSAAIDGEITGQQEDSLSVGDLVPIA